MIWHHGLLDAIEADYASTVFWYQLEPHEPVALPPFRDRLPSPVTAHALRALVFWPVVLGAKAMTRLLGA